MPDPLHSELMGGGPLDGAFLNMRPDLNLAFTLDIGDGKTYLYRLDCDRTAPCRLIFVETIAAKPPKAAGLRGGVE